ncbi:MAG TPA: non-reducing end alpha-L-arabinofuranosidase family hydrolase [Candidatus Limnocylindrales bacterium]|nr:non-reducing end alpha-L-arabinofuranosidase family hydrolase [Candidatus Limnocylindrales bacterium]
MKISRRRPWLAGAVATAVTVSVAAVGALSATDAQAASGCRVQYKIINSWPGGFGAEVLVDNLGDPVSGWQLVWSFTAGQSITQLWNGSYTQTGAQVTVRNASWNGSIATGGQISFGFNASAGATNPVPPSFALNGTTCTGNVGGSPTPSASRPPSPSPSVSPSSPTGTLPSSFRWSSSGILAGPKADGRAIAGIKDPSVVFHNGRYHVFASTAKSAGYNLVYFNFADWSQANSATFHYLDQSPIGTGYRAAPQVFFFAPQNLWYLVYQDGNAAYSTNPDISNPNGWTAPRHFYSAMPDIIRQNIGNGFWVDMWVICDAASCYLFSSDDNGHLYRSQTTMGQFPNGFTNTVIAMQDSNRNNLFEASNIYQIAGRNQYLMLIEAIGSDGRRWFRSWTSAGITGPWSALANTEANPFARSNNVTFSATAWTRDISHGEVVRSGNLDQTLTISPCNIRYLYQGMDPSAGGDYNSLPWRLALLTQTNSTC